MQRNFGSSLNRRLAARKGLTGLVLVLYPTGKSDPGAQTYRFISCCEKRRSDTACVRSCPLSSIECGNYRKYVEGNHIIIQSSGEASDNNNIKYEIHGIIGTRTSRIVKRSLHYTVKQVGVTYGTTFTKKASTRCDSRGTVPSHV